MNFDVKIFGAILLLVIGLLFAGCENKQLQEVKKHTMDGDYYNEMHRPQFHFTPEANWMNDPNGMFYYEGKYHLFYQYYPDSTVWGPMHWGHSQTEDLVHWEHLPIGLYPDSIGCIFSGGAVVDTENTSKLGSTGQPPIIATFTHHDFVGEKAKTNDFQKQSIAYSLDGGYEWIKYKENPVIPNTEKIKDFRDPKVVWHEASKKWILVLAAYDRVKFYGSPNLLDWEFLSDFAIQGDQRLWECPDLFPMTIEGTNETKWVLIVSIQKQAPNGGTASSYFIGDFNGTEFQAEKKKQKWLDWGTDNYAFVTWNNVPKDDGRILGIGWMSNWQYAQIVPTEKWRSAMTLPRELKLLNVNADYHLFSTPVEELQLLRSDSTVFEQMSISEEKELKGSFDPVQAEFDLRFNVEKTTAKTFGIQFENERGEYFNIQFNKEEGKMYVNRMHSSNNKFSDEFYDAIHSAPISLDNESLDVHLFMDVSSCELFINEGAICFTSIFFPSKRFTKVSLIQENGSVDLSEARIYSLQGAWNK